MEEHHHIECWFGVAYTCFRRSDPPTQVGRIGLEHTMKDREETGLATSAKVDVDCRTLNLGVEGFAECLRRVRRAIWLRIPVLPPAVVPGDRT